MSASANRRRSTYTHTSHRNTSSVFSLLFSTAFVTAGIFGCIAILIFFSLHLDEPPPRVREKSLARVTAEMGKGFVAVARNKKVLITSSTDAAKMIANGALMAFLPVATSSRLLEALVGPRGPGLVNLAFPVALTLALVGSLLLLRQNVRRRLAAAPPRGQPATD